MSEFGTNAEVPECPLFRRSGRESRRDADIAERPRISTSSDIPSGAGMQYRLILRRPFMGVSKGLCLHGLALNVCVRFRFAQRADQPRYCSSVTCSSQSTTLPSRRSWMAMCVLPSSVKRRANASRRAETRPIARPDFLDRTAPTLYPSHPCSDDQRLSERMGVPGGAGARFESYAGASAARRLRRLEERIDTDRAREIVCRTLAGRLEPVV